MHQHIRDSLGTSYVMRCGVRNISILLEAKGTILILDRKIQISAFNISINETTRTRMIQIIQWDKITLTGRLFTTEEEKPVTLWLTIQYIFSMTIDIGIYFFATIASYRFLASFLFAPTERGFLCSDPNIREKYYENTVPTLTLLVITLAGPFFIILFADFLITLKKPHKIWRQMITNSTYVYLDYVIAFYLATLSLDVIKCFVGRTRPNFLAMCSPKELDEICASDPDGFVPIAHCTSHWKSARNSKLSFPSGHATASVFSTVFLYFYFHGVQKRHPHIFALKFLFWFVTILFTIFTIYCCISRVTDCWHFPSDVIGGILLGLFLFHIFLHKYYKIFPLNAN